VLEGQIAGRLKLWEAKRTMARILCLGNSLALLHLEHLALSAGGHDVTVRLSQGDPDVDASGYDAVLIGSQLRPDVQRALAASIVQTAPQVCALILRPDTDFFVEVSRKIAVLVTHPNIFLKQVDACLSKLLNPPSDSNE
jgi:hypothetical protein